MPFSKKEVRKCHLTLFSKFWRLNCITPLKSTLKVNEELEKEWQHLWHMHFKRKFMSRNAWSSSREISYQTADSVWLGLRLCSHSQYCLGRKTDQLYLCKVKMLVAQSCPTPCDLVDCSPPGSSVHGILQAGILEWVAIPFSRISSRPRDWTQVSWITSRFFTVWARTGTELVESVTVLFGEEKLISCICISLYNSFPI